MKEEIVSIKYQEIGPTELEVIRSLWEKLKAHHIPLSPHFAARRDARSFDDRKQELMAKSAPGMLRVDLACAGVQEAPVAYCVASLCSDGTGEIDSLFVDQDYRRHGIGTVLTPGRWHGLMAKMLRRKWCWSPLAITLLSNSIPDSASPQKTPPCARSPIRADSQTISGVETRRRPSWTPHEFTAATFP
jgi:hypothetical protein